MSTFAEINVKIDSPERWNTLTDKELMKIIEIYDDLDIPYKISLIVNQLISEEKQLQGLKVDVTE